MLYLSIYFNLLPHCIKCWDVDYGARVFDKEFELILACFISDGSVAWRYHWIVASREAGCALGMFLKALIVVLDTQCQLEPHHIESSTNEKWTYQVLVWTN